MMSVEEKKPNKPNIYTNTVGAQKFENERNYVCVKLGLPREYKDYLLIPTNCTKRSTPYVNRSSKPENHTKHARLNVDENYGFKDGKNTTKFHVQSDLKQRVKPRKKF